MVYIKVQALFSVEKKYFEKIFESFICCSCDYYFKGYSLIVVVFFENKA